MTDEFFNKVRRVASQFANDDIFEREDWKHLVANVDSVQFIELIVALESEFRVAVPDEDLSFESFSDYERLYQVIFPLLPRK